VAKKRATRDEAPADTLSVAALFGRLDFGDLQLIYEPSSGIPATGVLIDDPTNPPPIHPGDVVLAVGTYLSTRDAAALVERAAQRGASAIVFRAEDSVPDTIVAVAEQSGLALLGLPSERTWDYAHAVVQAAVAASGAVAGFVAPPSDLFGLADAIAARVGGPVTIEAIDGTLIAFSGHEDESVDELRRQTILRRRVPDHVKQWAQRIELENPRRSEGVVRYNFEPQENLRSRLEITVRAGREPLGEISAIETDTPFGPEAERALEEGARVAALHLIHHRIAQSLDRRMRADLVRSLLEGTTSTATIAARLGLDPLRHATVVAFDVAGGDDPIEVERTLGLVWLRFQATYSQSAVASIGRMVYVVVSTKEAERPERIMALAERAVEDVRATDRSTRAAVGTTVASLEHVARSRADADLVLRVLAGNDSRSVAHIEDVRSAGVLLALRDLAGVNDDLRKGKVRILADHDAAHGTAYVATLRAYLDALGEGIPVAAARLGVHPNTMRYRLRKIAELAALNLDDPDERVVTELQLRLL
jgi:sugar diacid utilization regulator